MYQLIVYYTGPEIKKRWWSTTHLWYLNPQLYDDRSSAPIWNGGVVPVTVSPKENDLQSVLMREAKNIVGRGITVDKHANFIVEPDRIQISLEKQVED